MKKFWAIALDVLALIALCAVVSAIFFALPASDDLQGLLFGVALVLCVLWRGSWFVFLTVNVLACGMVILGSLVGPLLEGETPLTRFVMDMLAYLLVILLPTSVALAIRRWQLSRSAKRRAA